MKRAEKKAIQKTKADQMAFRKYMRRYWQLYAMMLVPLCLLLIFKYGPMLGNILAFRRFKPLTGPYGVSWAEPPLRYFKQFLGQKQFWIAFRNTLIISFANLAVNFPFPIIFAILFNELRSLKIRRFVQTVSYMPRFISTAVVISILAALLSPSTGIINRMLSFIFGIPRIYYLNEPGYFRFLYILTEMWQFTGWNAIVYLAAIAGINPEMFEAARIDGASRFQVLKKIILPLSKPIVIYTILTAFMGPWGDFVFARYISFGSSAGMNVAVGMFNWLNKDQINSCYTMFCAGGVLVAIPITLLFLFLQKYYVEGVTGGAVKG